MAISLTVFYHELEVAVKVTATVLCILFAGYFFNRRRNADLKATRMVLLGQALFILCFGITRVTFLASDYFSPFLPSEIIFYADASLNFLLWKISSLIGILAIIFLLIVVETYLVKISHYIFSIIAAVGLSLTLIFQDINICRWVTYITMPLALFGVVLLYIYLTLKGSGEIRKRAGMSVVGLFILAGGVLLDTTSAKNFLNALFGFFPAFVPVIIIIVGLAIYTYYNVKQ